MSLRKLLAESFNPAFSLGLEGYGVLNREREIVFYVKLSNFQQLEPLEVINQVQWKLDLGNGDTKFRSRIENDKIYTICFKRPTPDNDGLWEMETVVEPGFWKEITRLFGHHGYKKKRYIYPIPGTNLKYEIDVFLNESGNPHPWVKVDLEYPKDLETLPIFPFEIDKDSIIIGNDMSSMQEQFVDNLWENEWSRLDSAKGSLDPFYQPTPKE